MTTAREQDGHQLPSVGAVAATAPCTAAAGVNPVPPNPSAGSCGRDGPTMAAQQVLSFEVISEPVAMARPRVAVRGGRAHAYVPAKTAQAAWEIRQAAIAALGGGEPFAGPLAVEVTAYLRQPASVPKRDRLAALPVRRPDLDNLAKTALDGCSPLWVDDAQVVDLTVRKRYGVTGSPRWEIRLEEVSGC